MNEIEKDYQELEAEKIKDDIILILKGIFFGVCFIMFFVPLFIIFW